jgi:Uma2 family endonuclease
MYDLPSEFPEEPGLPDVFHDLQPQLLSQTLHLVDYSRDNYCDASDLNLYYDPEHPLWHKRPDWMLSVGVPWLYGGQDLRLSYVTWQEGKGPEVVVEFLSPGTEREDLGRFFRPGDVLPTVQPPLPSASPPGKLEVYERYLQVPHYIVYSRYSQTLRYFKLVVGRYEEQPLAPQPPLIWLPDLQLGLGIWSGDFQRTPGQWLRWCDQEGQWCLTEAERERQGKERERRAKEQERRAKEQERQAKEQERRAKEQERQAKEQERQAKERERQAKEQQQQRADRLAAKLRELGVDPDQVD